MLSGFLYFIPFNTDSCYPFQKIISLLVVLADWTLIYIGAGMVSTRFETRYTFRDELETADL